ncbi:MAG: 23S rRNA (adenine(2030)-N(6))-methyltransferase RlmJ [Acetobacteraceae bacterium]
MNYRHAFHAGGFADCVKHALLVWLVGALVRKPAPLFVLDTHAGAGAYDLDAGPAERTGEWRGGIGRLLEDTPEALADYVGLVRSLGLYPGSPALLRALLRPGDRMACCEFHPEEYAKLHRRFAHDPQVGVHRRDAWEALGALLPPAERRALMLIDPPFEVPDEFDRLLAGLRVGYARFRTGVFAAWYPIKHRAPVRRFLTGMVESGIRDVLTAEVLLREPVDPARLNGCGLLVVNPPFRFAEEAPAILFALLDRLGGREAGEGTALIRLADE